MTMIGTYRNARTRNVARRSASRLMATSERLERPKSTGCQEVRAHDQDWHDRECCGERHIVRDALRFIDHVPDELAVRDERRGDVVTEGQGEREDRAGCQGG